MSNRFKSYEQIRREVGDAAEYVRSEGGIIYDNAVAEQATFGDERRELGDGDYIEWEDELPPVAQNAVRVSTLQEFALAYQALGDVHGVEINPQAMHYGLTHEEGYMDACRQIGFAQRAYELAVTRSKIRRIRILGSFGWRPSIREAAPHRGVTKLAEASIVARPQVLSEGDEARLKAMGYPGLQQEVAERIRTAKDPRLASLPIPKGF